MNIRKSLSASALTGLLAVGTAGAATVVNGDFERLADLRDANGLGTVLAGEPEGWSYSGVGDKVHVINSATYAPSTEGGDHYVEALSGEWVGTLSQTVNDLTIGTTYRLSFAWGNRLGGFDFKVSMGDGTFSASGSGRQEFRNEAFLFLATSTSMDIEITWNYVGPNAVSNGAFDSFALAETNLNIEDRGLRLEQASAAVPLPASAALVGLGLLGLGALRRRRKI